MTETTVTEWEKELKVLLDQIRAHPSADLTRERDRAALLTRLIGERSPVG